MKKIQHNHLLHVGHFQECITNMLKQQIITQ
eukprot:UN10245